jgi:magnesium transporter
MMARGDALVREVMEKELVTAHDEMDQEALARLFAQADLLSIPVVDAHGRMQGIVTADDIVDVVREEATEDIQKIGGTAALDAPYLQVSFSEMIRKRGGWLTALFVGQTLTISAMGHFESQIDRAQVLSLFVPLILSSGGNCGSQASTLVIRAMALGEIRLRDWYRVFIRELCSGLTLGALLGALGLVRILAWQHLFDHKQELGVGYYGQHYILIASTVTMSVVGVATWGTLAGSLLPFMLKRVGLDPAAASAPLVATLVDVTGVLIYFTLASIVLRGTLL